jgi:molecular chaperone DnaJ
VATRLTVTLPAGINHGQQMRLSGKGDEGEPGGPPGDLYVVVEVKEHEHFRRDGDEIVSQVPISFPQACLGAKLKIPTVHGEQELELPAGTPSGKVFTLEGQGAPRLGRQGGRGSHHVQVVVAVPKRLSTEEEELVKRLGELMDGKVQARDKGFFEELKGWFGG